MSANEISMWIIAIFVLLGSLLSLISAIGLVRLPDIYTRSHAATKSATLGVLCILLGTFLYFSIIESHISARILLGIIFIFITAPVGGHIIARAAYHSGVSLWHFSKKDDLEHEKKRSSTDEIAQQRKNLQ